ncbi:MAG TPA: hypothetical protein VFU08_09595 [Candidatus Udaeobacter sp.]|nr:hypothetical protein [Candidatus Udaeobacter sp.]
MDRPQAGRYNIGQIDPECLLLAGEDSHRYSPEKCVGLLATLGALKQRPFCSMGCVVLNIEATTQPVSLL